MENEIIIEDLENEQVPPSQDPPSPIQTNDTKQQKTLSTEGLLIPLTTSQISQHQKLGIKNQQHKKGKYQRKFNENDIFGLGQDSEQMHIPGQQRLDQASLMLPVLEFRNQKISEQQFERKDQHKEFELVNQSDGIDLIPVDQFEKLTFPPEIEQIPDSEPQQKSQIQEKAETGQNQLENKSKIQKSSNKPSVIEKNFDNQEDSQQQQVQSIHQQQDFQIPEDFEKNSNQYQVVYEIEHNKGDKDNQIQLHKSDDGDEKIVAFININDKRDFVMKPLEKGIILQCTIVRENKGLSKILPKYHMYFTQDQTSSSYLMTCKRRTKCKTAQYFFSLQQKKITKSNENYLGKIRSNFLGTEYLLYDHGLDPEKCKDQDKLRKQLAVILYESSLFGTKGPRKIQIITPALKEDDTPYIWKPSSHKQGLLQKYKEGTTQGILSFKNKPPKWNDEIKAFVLNFSGRVDKPSVKNFQLIQMQDQEKLYFQFGRVTDYIFNLDFTYPLSPYQAFGIAISSFDLKLACE